MNIQDRNITLRAIELEDLTQLQVWANDQDIQYMLGGWHFPTNMNDQQNWYNTLSCSSNNQRFMVINNDGIKIGMANLVNINFKDGNAEHGLLLDQKYQRQGYGYSVVMTMMKYAFNELRLNRLETTIISNNQPSLNLFINKCGWQQEGVLRKWYFRQGQFIDKVILGILKEDYINLVEAEKL